MNENNWVISSSEHLFKKNRIIQINLESSWVDSLQAVVY